MSETIIYSMMKVGRVHPPSKVVLRDISLSYFYGAKIGVLGLNGSGKSSLLRIMAGVDTEYTGEAHLSPGYTVGFLEQEPELTPGKTVKEIVQEGAAETVALLEKFEEINTALADGPEGDAFDKLMSDQAKVMEELEAKDAWSLDDQLDFAMNALSCPPSDEIVDHLSGGERRRVALCRLLIQQPDILLLDEPTNHLDAESVHWLENHLRDYKGTVIAVTHDRYFLDNVAGWILELDRGHGIPWKGNYSSWLEQKQERLAKEEKGEQKRQKTLARELEWIKMNPKGRHAKSKARINSYEKLLSQKKEDLAKDLEIYIPPGPRLGDVVIEAKDVGKSFGDKVLYKHLNFSLPPGGIIGIVGPNGAGKSTLFKMISGAEKPDSGEFITGDTVNLGFMEQSRLSLDPDKSVWEVVSEGQETINIGGVEMNSRAYVARFNFPGSDQQKKVGTLSGGERNRLQLAILLKSGANVLLLDEPTNDLDVNTLRALEEALLNFAGCVVVISHDRWFLDRVATHILSFEQEEPLWFDGNFSEYESQYMKQNDQPRRSRASISRG